MAKYRVAVIGTVGKSVLIDDSLSSRVAALETQIANVGGVGAHSALTGLQQGDDHPQYTMWQAPETIAAPWNFSVIPFIQGEPLAEYIEDVVAGGTDPFIADSPSITWTYDDTGNHLQADVVDEYIEDLVGSMLVNTTYIDLDYGDSDGSIKAILDTGAVLDLVGTEAFQDSSTIDFTYDSGTKRTSAAVVQSADFTWTGEHIFTMLTQFTEDVDILGDNLALALGAGRDLRLYHDGTNSIIRNDTGYLQVQGSSLRVVPDSAALPSAAINADSVFAVGRDSASVSIGLVAPNGGSNGFRFVCAAGGLGALAAINTVNNSYLGYIGGSGYDGTNWQTGSAGLLGIRPGSTWSSTNRHTYATVEVTASGSTSRTVVAQFDRPSTATQTGMLLWDVDSATLARVTVGAADSGGAGFKVLRIPN